MNDFTLKAVVRFFGTARKWFEANGYAQNGSEYVPTYFDPTVRADVICPARDAVVSLTVNARGRNMPPEELAGLLRDLAADLLTHADALVAKTVTTPRMLEVDTCGDPLAGLLTKPDVEKKNAACGARR